MTSETEQAVDFFVRSVKLALARLDARIERLESAFVKEHPFCFLPEIPHTEEELALIAEAEEWNREGKA